MAKRYLSIEEAAEQLGIAKDALNRLRERGEVRGFADRGTFKFKADDIDELARRMEPSSDPEVPMLVDDDASVFDEPTSNMDDAPSFIRNLAANTEKDGSGVLDEFIPDGGSSDSDVRLVMDERLDAHHDSGPDVMLQFDESDSDVRLAADSGPNLLADSDSDVRLLADRGSSPKLSDSDSDVRLSADPPASASDSVLKMRFSDSDSDVRLDGVSGVRSFTEPDSDSDVMLAPASSGVAPKPDSDSDVMLVAQDLDEDSDSDVHLNLDDDAVPIGPQSDSDVQLLVPDSDSDVKMLDEPPVRGRSSVIRKGKPDSDSDVAVLPDESGVAALQSGGSGVLSGVRSGVRPSDSSVLLEDSEISMGEDSGISLTGKSGIQLDEGGSGIALEKVSDSGLSLEHPEADSGLSLFEDEDDDSEGITLADDDVDSGLSLDMDDGSGIALDIEADSGIALQSDDEGSDISLDLEEEDGLTIDMPTVDSGIALKEDDGDLQLTETLPTLKMPGEKRAASMTDTMLEVPALDLDDEPQAEESDFEIGAVDSGSQADTSVLLFDDEDESDDAGQAMLKRKKEDTDEEAENYDFDQEAEEEEPAAEDIDDGVFAGEEAFDDEAESGESASDYEVAPARAGAAAPAEYPWGMGTVISVGVSAITMLLCAMASIELVRSMWGWQAYSPANGWLITMLGGLMGK